MDKLAHIQDQSEPASFSFDHSQGHRAAQRSISKCLRLKTNQSFEGHCSHDLGREVRKSIIKAHDSQIVSQNCQRLAKEEYDLRTESLVKQYELRLSKQEEYYNLREWKLKEEIQNFENQTALLAEELRRARLSQKPAQQKCTLCGDGAVLAQYNKLLSQNEEHHKNCLSQKKELIRKAEESGLKCSALEQDHETISQEIRNMGRQLRNYKSKVAQLESQRDAALESVSEIERGWRARLNRLESESRQLQKQLAQKQNELSNLNMSKTTVNSTQSVLTNPQQSLKSSILKPRNWREDILVVESRRNSLARRAECEQRSLQEIANLPVSTSFMKGRVR